MSKLIAITFDDSADAFNLRSDIARMTDEYLLKIDDVVIAERKEDGKVKLYQAANLTGIGAVSGGWWGLLIGMLFLNPIAGTAIGAGVGALAGTLTDFGIDDGYMRDVSASLTEGRATVFLLVHDITEDKVLDRLQAYAGKGELFKTSLSRADEARIREVLTASTADA